MSHILESIHWPFANAATADSSKVFIYRGDREHPNAPGNKWHKLRHNLTAAQISGARYLASFGGPYSNHLHALGQSAAEAGLIPVAVVRGELHPELTPTLKDFAESGGLLWPSRRIDYRLGMASEVRQQIDKVLESVYWVPEGGSNDAGVLGCFHWADEIAATAGNQFDCWVVSAGTGATAAGLLANPNCPALVVIPAIKGGEGLRQRIVSLARKLTPNLSEDKLRLLPQYHQGGYARFSPELHAFLSDFSQYNKKTVLDPVYTGKAMFGLLNEVAMGEWPYATSLLIHSGGIQGWRGYDEQSNPFLQ